MKKLLPTLILHFVIIALMYLVGWILFDQLPAEIPTHWNAAGEVDAYMPKMKAIILFPSIALLVTLLFPLFRFIDPKREKYALFTKSWMMIQTAILFFFAYIYFVSLYIALNPGTQMEQFIFGGIGVLFILIGNYLGKIRQNYFVGIKTPWTLNNEEVWNKTQRVGGWSFVISGLILFAEAFLKIYLVPVMIFCIAFAALTPVIYSYFAYRKLEKK